MFSEFKIELLHIFLRNFNFGTVLTYLQTFNKLLCNKNT